MVAGNPTRNPDNIDATLERKVRWIYIGGRQLPEFSTSRVCIS